MIARIVRFALPFVLALAPSAYAQNIHTFSFAPLSNGGAPFTMIDGQPTNGIGYLIQVRGLPGGSVWWGAETPQSWGFPNNGYLPENTVVPEPGQLVWDNPGCGPTVGGCTAHSDTAVPFSGYGQGVTFNVHATFIVVAKKCTFRCDNDADDTFYSTNSTGGTGTATYTAPATVASLYRCGSDRRVCLR